MSLARHSLKRIAFYAAVVAFGIGSVSLTPAFAAGGGGGGGSGGRGGSGGSGRGGSGAGNGGNAKAKILPTCPNGQMYSQKKKKCVQMSSEQFDDDEYLDYAFSLAKATRYQDALDTLAYVKNGETPKALNYRGYITRKLGRTEEGIGYYLRSVALDPKYVQVREYLGEAYVIQGKLELAKEQLQIIGGLCGNTDCEEYEDLEQAIVTANVE